jgi:hypothetical protein
MVLEEQDIHADDDGYHSEHGKHDRPLPHGSIVVCGGYCACVVSLSGTHHQVPDQRLPLRVLHGFGAFVHGGGRGPPS